MNSQEVESAACGMMMRDPAYLAEAITRGLKPAHFANELCGRVFSACLEIWGEGLEVDLATISRKVGTERLAEVGRLRSAAPQTMNFTPFLDGILSAGMQSELLARLADISRSLTNRRPLDPIDGIVDNLVDLIGYCKGTGDALKTTAIADTAHRSLIAADDRATIFRNGSISGIATGFEMLDRVLGGFQPGFVYALGARTGVGKTTFAINVMLGAARRGHKVAFVTVEMSDVDIFDKMLARDAPVAGSRLLSGSISDADVDNIVKAAADLAALPILFVDVNRPTIDQLAFEILRLVKIEKVALVIVDYIQLFEVGDGRFRQPREEAKIVSARLKMLAKTYSVPLLVLSQLNRLAPENGEPELIHIAESDQIARDSDVVMFLYRDERDQHFLSIAKNRRGKRGSFPLSSQLEYSRFEAIADAN